MFGDRFSSSTGCSRWLHETAPGRSDQSLSCRFLKVATHPDKEFAVACGPDSQAGIHERGDFRHPGFTEVGLCGKAPRVVVEFGPGTGVMTRELLRLMPDDGTLLAFEISPRFVTYLRETVPDPRLQIVQASAETAATELSRRGIEQVDGVVSSLGISFMDMGSVDAIFRPLLSHLGKKGTITQFQYVTSAWGSMAGVFSVSMRAVMKRYFRCVQSTCVWLNLPPAFVITGHGGRNGDKAPPNGIEIESLGYTDN